MPRSCPFGGVCHTCPGHVQTKLTINQPGDVYEQEADRMADLVMRMPDSSLRNEQATAKESDGPDVRRRCSKCAEDEEFLQKKDFSAGEMASDSVAGVPSIVHDVLRSPGQPLDQTARAFFEPRFGHDFGDVRVHVDAKAAESARAVNALAYTVGNDVVFGAGQYTPGAYQSMRLLIHELTHVVQQRQPPLLQRACQNGNWQYELDGCSVPRIVAFLIGAKDKDNPAGGKDTQFANAATTGPCDHHDRCYQTCNTNPGAREACDDQMYIDMREVCHRSSEDASHKLHCYEFVNTYYDGVRDFGESAFVEDQRKVCSCRAPASAGPAPSASAPAAPPAAAPAFALTAVRVAFNNSGAPNADNCAILKPASLGVGVGGTAHHNMEMIFRVDGTIPPGTEFDILRTRVSAAWQRDAAAAWSVLERDPAGTNDDHTNDDECLTPKSKRIFVVDTPGFGALDPQGVTLVGGSTVSATATGFVRKFSFAEWVIARNRSLGVNWTVISTPTFSFWHSIHSVASVGGAWKLVDTPSGDANQIALGSIATAGAMP
jgi:hypothetical protein